MSDGMGHPLLNSLSQMVFVKGLSVHQSSLASTSMICSRFLGTRDLGAGCTTSTLDASVTRMISSFSLPVDLVYRLWWTYVTGLLKLGT